MKTTVTVSKTNDCAKCSGTGYISFYGHVKGGECFKCGATGKGKVTTAERPMTDAEVIAALAFAGFEVISTERATAGDWLADMFMTPAEVEAQNLAMIGARLMLEAI